MAAAATIADVQRIVTEASEAFASQATSIGEQGVEIKATKDAIDGIHSKMQLMLQTFDSSVENATLDMAGKISELELRYDEINKHLLKESDASIERDGKVAAAVASLDDMEKRLRKWCEEREGAFTDHLEAAKGKYNRTLLSAQLEFKTSLTQMGEILRAC